MLAAAVACSGPEPEVLTLADDVGSATDDPTITVSDNQLGPSGTAVHLEWLAERIGACCCSWGCCTR